MTRGLPASLTIHILGLALVLWLGNAVNREVYQPPRRIAVKMVQLPRPEPVVQPAEDPVVEDPTPPVQEEVVEDLTPKEIPEPKPEIPKEEPKPEPVVVPEKKPEEKPVEQTNPIETAPSQEQTSALPGVTGASVSETDADFPFAWYLGLMEGKIARHWDPKQMGFQKGSGVFCTVHFVIQKTGSVTGLTLVQGSGIGVYDREALRAVQAARLPALPPDFAGGQLGVTMTFNLRPGD